METYNLFEKYQSAYKKFHGTETAILKVQNDILWKLDNKHAVFLVLLDLSAAFDTIDHNILLSRLTSTGVRGPALNWITSYLSCRNQSVSIGNDLSSPADLPFGVPQGSVLGPLFFTIYASPVVNIARKENLTCERIELCISDIKSRGVSWGGGLWGPGPPGVTKGAPKRKKKGKKKKERGEKRGKKRKRRE